MDKTFEEYIEKLVNECLQGSKLAYLSDSDKKEMREKLRDHFYNVTNETLIDQLSDEQLLEIKDLDPASPEMEQKTAEFAASIPGFAVVLEEKLKKEMDSVLQTGHVPEA